MTLKKYYLKLREPEHLLRRRRAHLPAAVPGPLCEPEAPLVRTEGERRPVPAGCGAANRDDHPEAADPRLSDAHPARGPERGRGGARLRHQGAQLLPQQACPEPPRPGPAGARAERRR